MKASLGFVLLFIALYVPQTQALIMGMPWKDELTITSIGSLVNPEIRLDFMGPDCEYGLSDMIPGVYGFDKNNNLVPTPISHYAKLDGNRRNKKPKIAISAFPTESCNPSMDSQRKAHSWKLSFWNTLFKSLPTKAVDDYIHGVFTIDFCYQYIRPGENNSIIRCIDISYQQLAYHQILFTPQK